MQTAAYCARPLWHGFQQASPYQSIDSLNIEQGILLSYIYIYCNDTVNIIRYAPCLPGIAETWIEHRMSVKQKYDKVELDIFKEQFDEVKIIQWTLGSGRPARVVHMRGDWSLEQV